MNRYYVYTLINSLDGIPFYVGKGTGNRMHDHKKVSLKGKDPQGNSLLGNKIRKIIREGGDIEYQVVKDLSLNDAYELEIKLIKEIGRRDLGLGPLCNMTDGGDGFEHLNEEARLRRIKNSIVARKRPEAKRKASERMKKYHAQMSIEEKNRISQIISQKAKEQVRPDNIGDLIRAARKTPWVPWNKGSTLSGEGKKALSTAHKESPACKVALEKLWEENRRTGRLRGKNSVCYIQLDPTILEEIIMLYTKGWGYARIHSFVTKIRGIKIGRAVIINRIKESGVPLRKMLTSSKKVSKLEDNKETL